MYSVFPVKEYARENFRWLPAFFFVSLYSSWRSHSKYTGVVFHPLLQWITFCQNSPLRPIHLGWPYTAWLIASLSYGSPSLGHDSDPWSGWLDDITDARDVNFGTVGKMVRDRGLAWCSSWSCKELDTTRSLNNHNNPSFCPLADSECCWYLRIHFHEFLGSSDGKECTCNVGDLGLILRSCPGVGNCNPLQYSCLENSMDRGARWATVHGVPKSQMGLQRVRHNWTTNTHPWSGSLMWWKDFADALSTGEWSVS